MTWAERRARSEERKRASAGLVVVYDVDTTAFRDGWGVCTKCQRYCPVRTYHEAPRCVACWPQPVQDVTVSKVHIPFSGSPAIWGWQIHPEVMK